MSTEGMTPSPGTVSPGNNVGPVIQPSAATRLRLSRLVVFTVIAVAAGILVWAVPGTVRFGKDAPAGFWAMTVAALLVDTPLFGMSRREDLRVRSTLSVCFTFAIFVLWGPAPAIVVQAVAGAVTVIGQRYDPRAGLYFVARLICAAFVADLLVDYADPRPITTAGTGLNGGDLLTFILLGTIWFAVSYGLLAVARATVTAAGLRQAAAEVRFDLLGTAAAVLVVSPLLTTIPGWWPLLVVAPLIVWNRLSREQRRTEQQLGREPVSGLLNRQGLDTGVKTITALDLIEPEGPRPFGVVLVTAESLLTINRVLGRELYERVVAIASRRLIDAFGADRVGRLAGEDMVILMPDLTEADAVAQADKAAGVLEPRIEVDDIPFTLDPVAGIALSPRHGRELSTLLTKAELAAAEARRHGQRAALYVRQSTEVTQRRIEILRELRAALRDPVRRAEVGVLYQPQVHLATDRLSGVEALVRWTHPEWGPVPADELIEAIEPTEVMHLLTRHVLDTVAAQVRRWNDHQQPVRAAVNVSVQDLHEPGFVDEIGATLRAYGISPSQLTIEITERMLISDAERVAMVSARLTALGVGLSLDDFGTGYASLQQLRLLPLSEVKIDGSYVRGLVDNPADHAIVTSVHELARTLRVTVVAEGVEDERTALALGRLAGMIGQGYYFGRPMTADALRDWRYAPEPPPEPRPVRATAPGAGGLRAAASRAGELRRRLGLWRRSRR